MFHVLLCVGRSGSQEDAKGHGLHGKTRDFVLRRGSRLKVISGSSNKRAWLTSTAKRLLVLVDNVWKRERKESIVVSSAASPLNTRMLSHFLLLLLLFFSFSKSFVRDGLCKNVSTHGGSQKSRLDKKKIQFLKKKEKEKKLSTKKRKRKGTFSAVLERGGCCLIDNDASIFPYCHRDEDRELNTGKSFIRRSKRTFFCFSILLT